MRFPKKGSAQEGCKVREDSVQIRIGINSLGQYPPMSMLPYGTPV